ncbi:FHA domain-containing protein [Streptomyces sp. Je 1-79]|uniref:FHA domain-containing protein n=1 Tax=Streptomyces sp. Je 1-79 TaxID=2943847 RepID=UPI0021A3A309|nr:FHA domain-containing protein [Streptomyces sp. Je 1-79]MCT4352627.1 FHA domain-containing protein [Streptomyces sp. Je 1-79]
MPTCPNGHQSVSDDWCEVCGHRMAGAGAPAGAVPPPPPPPPAYGYPGPGGPGPVPAPGGYDPNATAQAELCPQCRTPREAMAPFCEECRWNFLTNTATSYTPVAPPSPQQSPPPGLNLPPGFQSPPRPQQQPDPYEYQGSRPSQMNRPAEPLSADPTHHQAPPQRPPVQQPPQQQPPQGFQQGPPPPPPSFFQAPPPGAPPAQQGPPAPPVSPQHQAPPGGGGDDWMLPPPSQQQAPQQQHAPQQHQQHAPQQAPQQHQQHPQPQRPQQQYQPPRPAAGWSAYIGPDREYFLAMMQRSGPEATGLNLPAYSPEQHLPLQGNQISIGRRRHSTGESPDIDLSVPPEDPGVSHQHAVLVQQPDGSWAVVDQNSTNGTTINGAEEPIQPYVPVQLQDGDRVHVGAWTTITIRRG